jgi:hypothetical protein
MDHRGIETEDRRREPVATRFLIGVLTSVTVFLIAGGGSALASPFSWNLPAADVSIPEDINFDNPVIGVAADGTTTIAWTQQVLGKYTVFVATRPAGSTTFGTPEQLSDPTGSGNVGFAYFPEVAVAPDGTTTVVWARYANQTDRVIQIRTRPAGSSTFGPTEDLSNIGVNSSNQQVAVAPDGSTTVAWLQEDQDTGDQAVVTTTRPAGAATFGPSQSLSPDGRYLELDNLSLTVGVEGLAALSWSVDYADGDLGLQVSTRPAGEASFGAPETISTPETENYDPRVAIGPDGSLTAVWEEYSYSSNVETDLIRFANRPAGSATFGLPQTLSAEGAFSFFPVLGTASDGTTTVAWLQEDQDTGDQAVVTTTRPAGAATFGPSQSLSPDGRYLQLAVAPTGAATIVWQEGPVQTSAIKASTRLSRSSVFGAPETISTPGVPSYRPKVAISANGVSTVTWTGLFADGTAAVQAVSSTPIYSSLQVSRSGSGSGSVTSDPAGIDCGSDCSEDYLSNTEVTLTATAAPGSTFTGWTGGGCSGTGACVVTMDQARSTTATFGAAPVVEARIASVRITGPSKVKRNRKAIFKVAIRNSGGAAATGVRLSVQGRGVKASLPVGGVAPLATRTVKIKVKFARAGKVKLTAKATSGNGGSRQGTKTVKVTG